MKVYPVPHKVGELVQYTGSSSGLYKNGEFGIIAQVVPILPAWRSAGYMYKIQFATREAIMKPDYFKVVTSIKK